MENEQASNADDMSVFDSSQTLLSEAPPTEATVETIAGEQVTEVPVDTMKSIAQDEQLIQTTDEQVVAESIPVTDDPNRIAYWQSQADLAKNSNSKMAQELEMYQNLVGRMAKGENPQSENPAPAQQEQISVRKPNRPTSYNEVDAYNDPDSDSFQYRLAKEEYKDSRIDQVIGAMQKQDNIRQQQVAQQQEQMVVDQAYSQVKNGFGWDDGKSASFVKWAQNPANVSIDVLAKVFEMQNAPNTATVQAQNKAMDLRQAGERLQVPRTTSVTTGQAEPQQSDQDMFNAGLLSHSRQRK
jgi:hypothetical protein|tara:strand:- start:60 stop:953 length:894 start_codon:yes stop_codon:yes gene_type:complete